MYSILLLQSKQYLANAKQFIELQYVAVANGLGGFSHSHVELLR